MSDDDNPHNGESPPPKSKGGGKSRHPRQPSDTSLKNLKRYQWKAGQSGNPAGLPKSVIEIARLAREHSAAAIERLSSIMMNDDAPYRDQIQAATVLLDRGCGRAPFGVYHSTGGANFDNQAGMDPIDGNRPSVLLIDAARRRDAAYAAELRAELARIEAMEASERKAKQDELDAARAALRNGEEVSGAMRMLIAVRDATH